MRLGMARVGAASLPVVISFCSRMVTLEAGDVIMTGTPWGTGEFMSPKRCLAPGDVVETSVEGIGTLRNPVAAA